MATTERGQVMIIIIEGPDGSGKTMLAEKLAKQNKCSVVHRQQPKTEEDKRVMMEEYVKLIKSNKTVILDRSWYSELAYGPVMRDESVISYPEMYVLEELLARLGGLIIYATGSKTTMWNRCQHRGEDYITDRDTFNTICDNFDVIMNTVPHHIPVVRYEYQDL